MLVTRLDLDGTGSPFGIATRILTIEKNLTIPIKIEQLALQLDISKIQDLKTDAFEGCLVTDQYKSKGGILVKSGIGEKRRRFTIGHELGHFLIPTHRTPLSGMFECSKAEMSKWNASPSDLASKMEVEANNFSSLILMPPSFLRPFIEKSGDPDLSKLLDLHEHFNVSKEAAARAYATYHSERIATCVVKDQRILRIYKGNNFPKLSSNRGDPVPTNILSCRTTTLSSSKSEIRQIEAGMWLELEWGQNDIALFEQVLFQRDNFAIVLLWAEIKESDFDPDENKTSKQRLQDRIYSHNR